MAKTLDHFVPRLYLRKWTADGSADGLLFAFMRRGGKIVPTTPARICAENGWDSIGGSTTSDNPWADFLSEVESAVAPLLPRLEGAAELNPDEREGVAEFVCHLAVRGRDFHNLHEQAEQVVFDHLQRFRAAKGLPRERDHGYTLDSEGRVTLTRDEVVRSALEIGPMLSARILDSNWQVWVAPKDSSWITSDCPFVFAPTLLKGGAPWPPLAFLDPDLPKLLPLSPRSLLLMHGSGRAKTRVRQIGASRVRELNVLLAKSSGDVVLGRDEAHVRSIVSKARLEDRGPKPRVFPPPEKRR